MRSTQTDFYALNMAESLEHKTDVNPENLLQRFPIEDAERDQSLRQSLRRIQRKATWCMTAYPDPEDVSSPSRRS